MHSEVLCPLSFLSFLKCKNCQGKKNAVKNKVIHRFCAQRAQEAVKQPSTFLSLPPCCTPRWHMAEEGGGVLQPSRPSVPTTVPSLTPRSSLQGTRLLAPPAAQPFEGLSVPSSLGRGHSTCRSPSPCTSPRGDTSPEEVWGSTAQHSPRASTGPQHPLTWQGLPEQSPWHGQGEGFRVPSHRAETIPKCRGRKTPEPSH